MQSGTNSSDIHKWPSRVPALVNIWSHLAGHTAQHCRLTESQLVVTDCVCLGHGDGGVG